VPETFPTGDKGDLPCFFAIESLRAEKLAAKLGGIPRSARCKLSSPGPSAGVPWDMKWLRR